MATYGVIGLGQLGMAIATELASRGADVIAVDRVIARVEAVKDDVGRALRLDTTDEKALRASGLGECSCVVLALGEKDLEQAVLTAMMLRQMSVGRIISRASTDVQGRVLERLGVNKVVFPERQIGRELARQILAPSIHEFVALSTGMSVAEVLVPHDFVGKTLQEIELRVRFQLNAIALKRSQETIGDDGVAKVDWRTEETLMAETRLEQGNRLVVVGTEQAIRSLAER